MPHRRWFENPLVPLLITAVIIVVIFWLLNSRTPQQPLSNVNGNTNINANQNSNTNQNSFININSEAEVESNTSTDESPEFPPLNPSDLDPSDV